MSSTISVRTVKAVTVTETFSDASSGDNTATWTTDNTDATLNASSSVPVTKHANFNKTLSTGAGTIDLTALPGITADETVNGTGLKVQKLMLTNPNTNANKMTISQGASVAYRLDGATNWSVVLGPGQSCLFELDEGAEDIGASHKNIDIAGTGSQILHCRIVMG